MQANWLAVLSLRLRRSFNAACNKSIQLSYILVSEHWNIREGHSRLMMMGGPQRMNPHMRHKSVAELWHELLSH